MNFLASLIGFLVLLASLGTLLFWLQRRDDEGFAQSIFAAVFRLLGAGLVFFVVFTVNYIMSARGLTFMSAYEIVSGVFPQLDSMEVKDPIGGMLLGGRSIHTGTIWGLAIILTSFALMSVVVKNFERLLHDPKPDGWAWARQIGGLAGAAVVAFPVVGLDLLLLVMRLSMTLSHEGISHPSELPSLTGLLYPPTPTLTTSVLWLLIFGYPVLIFVAEMQLARALAALTLAARERARRRPAPAAAPAPAPAPAPAVAPAPVASPAPAPAAAPEAEIVHPQGGVAIPLDIPGGNNGVVRRVPGPRRRG